GVFAAEQIFALDRRKHRAGTEALLEMSENVRRMSREKHGPVRLPRQHVACATAGEKHAIAANDFELGGSVRVCECCSGRTDLLWFASRLVINPHERPFGCGVCKHR